MGLRETDTDTIGHHELGILDKNQIVFGKRDQSQFSLFYHCLMSQITFTVTSVTQ